MRFETNFKETEIWKIPVDWEVVELGDIVDFKNGVNYNKSTLWDTKFKIINVKDLSNSNIVNIWELKEIYIDYKKVKEYLLKKEDIVIARSASPWEVLYLSKDFDNLIYSGFSIRIRLKNIYSTCLSWYLYIYLLWNKERLLTWSNWTIFSNINQSSLSSFQILLPSLSEQQKIADFLWTIDDKIELNNQINKKLEETAQAMFKSWFIDFEPFQDWDFVDSEMGKIPKGWRVGKLGDVVDLITDWVHNTPKLEENWVPMLDWRDIVDNFIIEDTNPLKFISTQTDYILSKRCKPKENDVLLSSRWTVWKIAIVRKNQDFNIMWNIILIRCNNNLNYLYVSNYLLSYQDHLLMLVKWAVQKALYLWDIRAMNIIIPSNDILNKYVKFVFKIQQTIFWNYNENQKLAEIKNYFLLKLISGEIRLID